MTSTLIIGAQVKDSEKAVVSSLQSTGAGSHTRVTKLSQRQTTPNSQTETIPANESVSDTDLVDLLIHRQRRLRRKARQDEAIIHNHAAKIRSLNHTVQELECQQDQCQQQVQEAKAALVQAEDDRKLLEDRSDMLRAKYSRIKDFARTIASEMKSLRQSGTEHAQASLELRHELVEVREQCQANLSKADNFLNSQVRNLASIRQDLSAAHLLIEQLRRERDANASLVDEERAKNCKLAKDIAILRSTQEKSYAAHVDANQAILQTLAEVKTYVQNVGISLKPDLQIFAEHSKLLDSLCSKDDLALDGLDQLKEKLNMLDDTMNASIVRLEQACIDLHQKESHDFEIMFKELRSAFDMSTAKAEELRVAEQKLAGFEQKVKDDPKLVEELERSRTDARTYAQAFQNATEQLLECMAGQQSVLPRNIAWYEELRKWQSEYETAKSQLVVYRKQNADIETDRNALCETVDGLQSKLSEETAMIQTLNERVHDRDSQIATFITVAEQMKAKADGQRDILSDLEATLAKNTTEARDLSVELNALKERHAQCEFQLQESASINVALKNKHETLTAEHLSLDQEHRNTLKQLATAHTELKSAVVEVEQLKEQIGIYQKRVDSLRQEVSTKDEAISSLNDQVKEGRAHGHEVLALRDELRESHEKQQTRVKELAEKADKAQGLRDHLHATALKVEDLEKKLAEARDREADLKHLANENTVLNQSLKHENARANAALQQLQDRDSLQDSIRQKEGCIKTLEEEINAMKLDLKDHDNLKAQLKEQTRTLLALQGRLEEMMHLRAAFDQQKHGYGEKENKISQLKGETARHTEEIQLVDGLTQRIDDAQPDPEQTILLEAKQTQGWEGQQIPEHIQQGLEADIVIPDAVLDLGKDDAVYFEEPQRRREEYLADSIPELQPRRRVADRSGLNKPRKKTVNSNPGVPRLSSSDSASVVPDSRLATPGVSLESGTHKASSSLGEGNGSDLPSDIEGFGGLTAGGGKGSSGLKSRKLADMRSPASSRERPTTAQTDLFNFHTWSLSSCVTEHMSNRGRTKEKRDKIDKAGDG
ncbi:hypothetical protein DV738_g5309, partial [Chaetothyriales sp. CBS 135597]